MGQTRPLLVYFRSFHNASTNFIIDDKSIDGILGSQTRGGMMEGADESTELWRHPTKSPYKFIQFKAFSRMFFRQRNDACQ